MRLIFISSVIAVTLGFSGGVVSASGADPCQVPILETHVATFPYGIADKHFLAGRYASAFRAYYRVFFCPNDGGTYAGLNPEAFDVGVDKLFRLALVEASEGEYRSAVGTLKHALTLDVNADEARYLIGNVLFASGEQQKARSAWRAALRGPFFPHAPDDTSVPPPVEAAREMLRRFPG